MGQSSTSDTAQCTASLMTLDPSRYLEGRNLFSLEYRHNLDTFLVIILLLAALTVDFEKIGYNYIK